jgi:hypothetical protein
MMRTKCEKPLMRESHLPLIGLGTVMIVYGLLNALVSSWFANQAMRGLMSTAAYRTRLASFEQVTGLIAGILFFILFIMCAVKAAGIARVGFAIGALASAGPLLTGSTEYILFRVIALPTMSAGSVLAGAVTTLFFALPMTFLFILLTSGRCIPRQGRGVSLVSVFIVLATALFPIYVTVLAFLLKPGDPAVGRMMEVSSRIIKLRYILPGLSLILLSFISQRFTRHKASEAAEVNTVEKGE